MRGSVSVSRSDPYHQACPPSARGAHSLTFGLSTLGKQRFMAARSERLEFVLMDRAVVSWRLTMLLNSRRGRKAIRGLRRRVWDASKCVECVAHKCTAADALNSAEPEGLSMSGKYVPVAAIGQSDQLGVMKHFLLCRYRGRHSPPCFMQALGGNASRFGFECEHASRRTYGRGATPMRSVPAIFKNRSVVSAVGVTVPGSVVVVVVRRPCSTNPAFPRLQRMVSELHLWSVQI